MNSRINISKQFISRSNTPSSEKWNELDKTESTYVLQKSNLKQEEDDLKQEQDELKKEQEDLKQGMMEHFIVDSSISNIELKSEI